MENPQTTLLLEQKVLIHLLDFTKHRGKFESPSGVTVIGISRALHVHPRILPPILEKLKSVKLVDEEWNWVVGCNAKKRVYYLTPTGVAEAKRILEDLKNRSVKIRHGTREFDAKFCDINSLLGLNLRTVEILCYMTEDGYIDLNQRNKYRY
jgi:Mn-dependent DtxR family transcriptional regulator